MGILKGTDKITGVAVVRVGTCADCGVDRDTFPLTSLEDIYFFTTAASVGPASHGQSPIQSQYAYLCCLLEVVE